MKLRIGKTKSILESSINSALLAVEVYNKPRIPFRSQCFITFMIMAWTKLFHAHFYHEIGDKYYYKEKNGRYKIIDGEKKAWELKTCINKYSKLKEPIKQNLLFFIGLRNKIEHRHINKKEIDTLIFGECQALLYNYENTLINFFSEKYALNENLVYSLQFSRIRTEEQVRANKMALSSELTDIKEYINKYKNNLNADIYNSQEYSIKLIQIPRISNTNRNYLAIEFVNWSELNKEDQENYKKLDAIIKEKVLKKEAVNVSRLKPGTVLQKIEERTGIKLSHNDHKYLYTVFSIRPRWSDPDIDFFNTDTSYCHYDEVHDDYVYKEEWVDFIVSLLDNGDFTIDDIKEIYDDGDRLNINNININNNG